MAALDRALTLVEMEDRARRVAEDLDLDVARTVQVLLHVEVAAAERRLGAPGRGRERGRHVLRPVHPRHADPAAAGRSFQDHRVADIARGDLRLACVHHGLRAPGDHGHARRGHEPARLDLVAHRLDRLRRRPDEHEAGPPARLGEAPVLGEEAIARMDRVGARLARRIEDALDVEVALARRRRADRHRAVGVPHVERVAVRLRVHRDGLDAELAAGAEHAPRDLSPVSDQDRPDQRCGRADWAASTRATSSAAKRQPPSPGTQRVRSVTAPSAPSRRSFTRRWWPSRAKATTR